MSITRNNPNTVFLGGDRTQINDLAAKVALTPGFGIERVNTAGVIQWQLATAASAGCIIACDHPMANKGVDDAYAIGDLVEAGAMHRGAAFWGFIASGQNIVAGNRMEHAGDGTLRILASGVAVAMALENKPNVAVRTRIRLEAL